MLDETTAQGSRIKWTVYYEDEKKFDRTLDELVADLDYLKKWFAWHPSWAHKDGKPIIFIWNESECEVADRWAEAAKKGGWYVVLKLFGDYEECKSQPDSWHQYVSASLYNSSRTLFDTGDPSLLILSLLTAFETITLTFVFLFDSVVLI